MTVIDRNSLLSAAREAAAAAAIIVKKYRADSSFTVGLKGELDMVTTADVESEKKIVAVLSKAFPDHEFLTEEQFPGVERIAAAKKPLWIVDPIDGTTNYVYGLPHVGISIGCFFDGALQVGVVAAPFLNEEFTAIRDGGAFLNGQRIRVRDTDNVRHALVATGFPYNRDHVGPIVRRAERIVKSCRDLRRLGAASLDLCCVACGRLDAYYETVNPWDIAGGALVVREAGGMLGNFAPAASAHRLPPELNAENLLAATPKVFEGIKALLTQQE